MTRQRLTAVKKDHAHRTRVPVSIKCKLEEHTFFFFLLFLLLNIIHCSNETIRKHWLYPATSCRQLRRYLGERFQERRIQTPLHLPSKQTSPFIIKTTKQAEYYDIFVN
jgi:hypothetical protein